MSHDRSSVCENVCGSGGVLGTAIAVMSEPDAKARKTQPAAEEAAPEGVITGSEFFASLQLAPSDHLDGPDKFECAHCHKKYKYYCYGCMRPIGEPARTPTVQLPFALDM